jgi:RNA polymerase sigma-70 factor (ECF subfamily)
MAPASEVERILRAGRAAAPAIAAGDAMVASRIARRLEGEEDAAGLDAVEVFLACACAAGDAAAMAELERRFFAAVPAALARLGLGRDEVAEVQQVLRVKLFVADGGAPRIEAYAGHGQLGGLVRVAAIRAGLDLLRQRGRIDQDADGFDDLPVAADDPELARLKAQHRAAFKAAFEDAVRGLAARERSLLGLAIVKGLGIDKVAAIYGVHRATAARWITQARANLTHAVQERLGARLGVDPAEAAGLLPLVESQLELSLERLLRTGGA